MQISTPCVVGLTWRLEDALGNLIDELTEPVEFFFGGDDLLAKVEQALDGQESGFETSVHLEPEQAFGDYNAALVCFEDRSLFPENAELGMQFDGLPDGATTAGMPNDVIYTITEMYPSHVVLDGNHPLAGLALRLHVKVRGVRDATDEEAEAGSVGEPVLALMNGAPVSSRIH